MKFENISETCTTEANMSCLQGHVNINYFKLVELFGEAGEGDPCKIQKEWTLKFEDGTIATIYDYKWGDCYNGHGNGTHYTEVPEWNIGGFNLNAVHHVLDVIQNGVDNDAIEGELVQKALPAP